MINWMHDPRFRSWVRRCLERHAWLRPWIKKLKKSPAIREQICVDIHEVTPFAGRISDFSGVRLNLIVPSVQNEHLFGGILTALRFFESLTEGLDNCRIILSDQSTDRNIPNRWTSDYTCLDALDDDRDGRLVIPFGDRGSRSLAVRRTDIFVATAWWTAYGAQRLSAWQAEQFGIPALPLVYLIQDHEPGFYPWSSRYALAQSTYCYPGPQIGVFNTSLLRDWFVAQGYRFSAVHAFEPHLNPVLMERLHGASRPGKVRRLLVYGRPDTPRNVFELLCLGIREWCHTDPEAGGWEIISLGETHLPVGLPNGGQITALGKVSLEKYAEILHSARVGISLMLSPHPSYPPLEMAAFGLHTITNRFGNKDLTGFSPLIQSLAILTPEAIAAALRVSVRMPAASPEDNHGSPLEAAMLNQDREMFPFMSSLRADLLQAVCA